MNRAQVSVVIPAHNGARFLAEAVASVRAQTVAVAEIIVVDDGSTDGTAALAATLGADIRCHSQAQAGAAAARNRGAELAGAEWLAFLDADDLWLPEKTAVQLDWLARQTGAAVVFGHGCNFTQTPAGPRREAVIRPAWLPGAVLVRRDFFLRAARFDPRYRVSEVIDWNLRLQAGGAPPSLVPELVLLRRLHPDNTRRQRDGGRQEDLTLLREWVRQKRM